MTLAAALMAASVSYGQDTKSDAVLRKFNTELAAKAPEDSLSLLAMKYARAVKRQSAYDSLNEQIVALYPKGNTATTNVLMKMYGKSKSGDLTLNELQQLKTDYPNKNYDNPQSMVGSYYAAIIGSAFPGLFEKDSVGASSLIPQMSASSLNEIAWNFAEAGKHLATAEKMSGLSLEKTKTALADSSKVPEGKRAERKEALQSTYASFEDTYAYTLSKLGKKKEALKYQTEAILATKDNAEMNGRYVTLLNENGQYKKALEVGSTMYGSNRGDSDMLKQIAVAYKKENKGKSPDAYLASLQSQQAAAAKADMVKNVLNKPSFDFSLKDLNGKTVSLSDYKGKVVVLDFWATWCGYCKMSFPGMQLAINRYKDNPNVVFLFIDTWERTEPKEKEEAVSKYIASKNFTFNVLYDKKINDSDYEVVKAYSAYGIDGIPVKFFIGKDGKVKFKEEGYAGSDEKVLSSVVERVDYLLSES